jgi:acyl-CoA thioester hydrolase
MQPIVYASNIEVRFSDLDSYGHVKSSLYLDYVIASRFRYAAKQLNVDDRMLIERGIGFYLAHAESRFVTPVVGIQDLSVSSWVERIDGANLYVPYEIRLPDERIASEGRLRFVVIDLRTKKPSAAPDWVLDLFQVKEP